MSRVSKKSAQSARKGGIKRAPAKRNARWNGIATQKDHRREAILRSVANVLRDSRLPTLTIKQIADELGMTRGNLYYYFKDKQDILYHCHMRSVEISLRALVEAHETGGTPRGKLRILLVRHIRCIIDDGFGSLLQTGLEKIRPAQRRHYITKRDELERGVRELIDEGVRAGEFECDDVKLAGFAILGGINWIPKWYRVDGPCTSEQISERMADYFLRGLQPGATQTLRSDDFRDEPSPRSRHQELADTETWQ